MNPDHHQIAERIYTEHREAIHNAIARRNRLRPDDPRVQDAVSIGFQKLLRHLDNGGTINDERSWLIAVCDREYYRPLTSLAGRRTGPLEDWAEDRIAHPGPTPEDATIDAAADDSIQRALRVALGRLSKLQRDVITAQASGLTYAEISERTGLSATAVDKAIQRARRNLRNDGTLTRELNTWRA